MQVITRTFTQDQTQHVITGIGPHVVQFGGNFGGATLTPYRYAEGLGQGSQLELGGSAYSATAADDFNNDSPSTLWVVTGATGTTNITLVATPKIQGTVRA